MSGFIGAGSSSDAGLGGLTTPSIAANSMQLQNALVDAMLRSQPFVPPTTWYIALVTQLGNTVSPGVEVTGGSYARAVAPATLTLWSGTQGPGTTAISSGLSGLISNNSIITYQSPTANWGTIVGYEFWDAASSGNRWFAGKLGTALVINSGDPARKFPVAALSVAIG